MKVVFTTILAFIFLIDANAQDSLRFKDQYKSDAKNFQVIYHGKSYLPDTKGKVAMPASGSDSFIVKGENYKEVVLSRGNVQADGIIHLKKQFNWTDLLTPMFYIVFGGLWFILFVVFAETGLFAGFFLPGDSLLFVTGILAGTIVESALGIYGAGSLVNLLILGVLISLAGILGNFVGYWFGRKSGPFLFERKDTFFFRKKYLYQAKEFYEKHGGGAIVIARFLPIIRTFAPIVAGIVGMKKAKFTYYNIVGCIAWVFTMLIAGHYLERLFLRYFNFDLKEHLEAIVIGIVLITTAPVLIKLFFGKVKTTAPPVGDQSIH